MINCTDWDGKTERFAFLPSFTVEAPSESIVLRCTANELNFFRQVFTADIAENIIEQAN